MVDETSDGMSYRKCLNCGKQEGYVMEGRAEREESRPVAESEPEFTCGQPCAALVRGGGTCATTRIYGELYCKRHLEKVKAEEPVLMKDEPNLCSVPGCKKPQYTEKGTVQCKRHYEKALRNNTKYRARANQALNGTADGTTWKSPVLETLFSQRELAAAKLQDIDRAITAIKGL